MFWNSDSCFPAKLDEETKIRPESLTLDMLKAFAASVNLDRAYVDDYLRRLEK